MKRFKILIPCYNDWKSLFKLLGQIDFYIKANEWKGKFFNTLNVKNIFVEEETDFSNPPF